MRQSVAIEEELFKLRLRRRCEAAIDAAQTLFPASGSDSGSNGETSGPVSGGCRTNPAATHSSDSNSNLSGNGQTFTLGNCQSPESVGDGPDRTNRPAQPISPFAHYPKGRW